MKDFSGVYLDILNERKLCSKGSMVKDVKYKLKDVMSDVIDFHNIHGRGNLVIAKTSAGELPGRIT